MSNNENNGKDSHQAKPSSHPSHDAHPILPPRGDYHTLLSFQKAEIVYDITFRFATSSSPGATAPLTR
jgi:hypothetical protein